MLAKHRFSQDWQLKQRVFRALKHLTSCAQSLTLKEVHINSRLEMLEQSLARALAFEKESHSVQDLLSDIDSYRAKEWAALRDVNGRRPTQPSIHERLSQLEKKILRH